MSVATALKQAREANKLAGQAHQKAEIALVKHDEHEKVCAERYDQIISVHHETQGEIKAAKNWLIIFLVTSLVSMSVFTLSTLLGVVK